jgi:hypothetical protein
MVKKSNPFDLFKRRFIIFNDDIIKLYRIKFYEITEYSYLTEIEYGDFLIVLTTYKASLSSHSTLINLSNPYIYERRIWNFSMQSDWKLFSEYLYKVYYESDSFYVGV